MLRVLILLFMVTLVHQASSIDPMNPPLFVKVTGVAEDDLLNVRKEPNYRSIKVGTQVPGATMGVERCKRVDTSIWCKVYQTTQNFYSEDFHTGWVNARYLKPINSGYVIINNIANCDYALSCKKGNCEVVTDYEENENAEITKLTMTTIKREALKGESNFGAMSQEQDGYCTGKHRIEDYLRQKSR